MPSAKQLAVMFLVTAVAVAVIFRVDAIKRVVVG